MLRWPIVHHGALLFVVAKNDFLHHFTSTYSCGVFIIANQVHQGPVIGNSEGFPIQLNEEFLGKLPIAKDFFPV